MIYPVGLEVISLVKLSGLGTAPDSISIEELGRLNEPLTPRLTLEAGRGTSQDRPEGGS